MPLLLLRVLLWAFFGRATACIVYENVDATHLHNSSLYSSIYALLVSDIRRQCEHDCIVVCNMFSLSYYCLNLIFGP